ncbi:hypothetical protein J2W46_003085 [Paraburkholderia strydomiana]|nr:hypothetical protein [Paraburkholderia strydomiana]
MYSTVRSSFCCAPPECDGRSRDATGIACQRKRQPVRWTRRLAALKAPRRHARSAGGEKLHNEFRSAHQPLIFDRHNAVAPRKCPGKASDLFGRISYAVLSLKTVSKRSYRCVCKRIAQRRLVGARRGARVPLPAAQTAASAPWWRVARRLLPCWLIRRRTTRCASRVGSRWNVLASLSRYAPTGCAR